MIGLSALLVAGLAVYVNLTSHRDPSAHIQGARNGVVPGLVLTNPDYDRWFITTVEDLHTTRIEGNVSFVYYTALCDEQGFVGYAADLSAKQVRLTFVAGESGDNCDDVAVPHHGEITLREPLAGRHVVVVRPFADRHP